VGGGEIVVLVGTLEEGGDWEEPGAVGGENGSGREEKNRIPNRSKKGEEETMGKKEIAL